MYLLYLLFLGLRTVFLKFFKDMHPGGRVLWENGKLQQVHCSYQGVGTILILKLLRYYFVNLNIQLHF